MKGGIQMQTSPSAGRYLGQLSNKIRRRMDAFNFSDEFSGAQGKILHFMLAQSEDVFQRDIEEAFSLRSGHDRRRPGAGGGCDQRNFEKNGAKWFDFPPASQL